MELLRALAALAETPGTETIRLAEMLELEAEPSRSDYTELFLLQLPPYASVYVGATGSLGGDVCERIALFWRFLGQRPPNEPDHLAVLLSLYAWLVEREREEEGEEGARISERNGPETWRHLRATFLWEHLLSWLPMYLATLQTIASPAYAAWGRLLSSVLQEEAQRGGMAPLLPPHLRDTPALAHPGTGSLQPLITGLLVPAQSGGILTRADLVRAGRHLGLGIRVGERRTILTTLLQQDGEKTLGWLAAEASAWADHHAGGRAVLGELAAFWETRAAATARLLETLRDEASEIMATGRMSGGEA